MDETFKADHVRHGEHRHVTLADRALGPIGVRH